MELFTIIFTILGLVVFESVFSIDNAIINAEVLSTMQKRAQRWFLLWGILFAVFFVRGLLPWFIVWAAIPSLGPIDAFMKTLSSDPDVVKAIRESAPILLAGGGIFLILLFLHWITIDFKEGYLFKFIEKPIEHTFKNKRQFYFYIFPLIIIAVSLIYFILNKQGIYSKVVIASIIGTAAYLILDIIKRVALKSEKDLLKSRTSDISKIVYLEILDMSFSIDGVFGAFAFTLSIPLILIGNGIGAIVVRQLTVAGIDKIKKYIYLKNGAMYSIMALGIIMFIEGFGKHVPSWIAPLLTIFFVGFSFIYSRKKNKENQLIIP